MSLQLRVTAVNRTVHNIVMISFETLNNELFFYQAGQFLTLIFELNGKEHRRSYSFCSSPAVNEPLTIAVKMIENGEISRFLHHQLQVGDQLNSLAPNGQFVYRASAQPRTLFLFAAGIGITPLFSILKTALLAETHTKLVLVYSNKSKATTLFFDELEEWKANYPDRLEIIHLWSTSKNLMRARLNSFLIAELVKKHLSFDLLDAEFYLCGPVDYMDSCRFTLLGQGFHPSKIKRETFLPPENEADDDDMTEKIIDNKTYMVNIDYFGKKHRFAVPPDQRILEVALAKGIDLPYSCAGGVCSTCIADCTKGGVRMEYNEVLTEQEIAAGKVLVCTGHPTADETTIVWR